MSRAPVRDLYKSTYKCLGTMADVRTLLLLHCSLFTQLHVMMLHIIIVQIINKTIAYCSFQNAARCSPQHRGLVLETASDRNFVVLVFPLLFFILVFVSKDQSWPYSRPISNLLAGMHRKIIILFAQVNNKDCNFYKFH